MGCVLIRKGVFERLKYPWFSWVSYESGATLSEDLHFCADCGRAKIPVYVDARVGCGHMLRRVVWPEG